MKCMHCRGEISRGKAPFNIDRKEIQIRLSNVPAWICEQCGEAFFEETEVDAIQEIIRSIEDKAIKLSRTA